MGKISNMADIVRLSSEPSTITGNTNVLHYNTDYLDLGQQFTTTSAITGISKIVLKLKKVGAPSGNMSITIETDSSNNPSGTVVTNGTSVNVACSGLTTDYANYDFTFSSELNLSAGTKYHIVLTSTHTTSITNYVAWAQSDSDSYSGGITQRQDTGGTWYGIPGGAGQPGADMWFQIWGDPLPTGGSFLLNFV